MIDLTKVSELKFDKVIDKIEDINGLVIYEAWKNLTANGVPPLTLTNCKGEDLIDYKMYGNSVQNGTPTPETPIEVESVGDKTKNLFDKTLWEDEITQNGLIIQYLKKEDCFLLNGTVTTTNQVGLKYINIPINKNDKFSLSAKYVSGTINRPNGTTAVAYFGKNDEKNKMANWINVSMYQYDTKKENQVCDTNYITAFWFYISKDVSFDNYKVRIQLEKGSVATEHEPYGYKIPVKISNDTEEFITNIYLDEPLRKIGDYADYIDFSSGKIVRNVKKYKVLSTLSWTFAGGYFGCYPNLNADTENRNYAKNNYYPIGTSADDKSFWIDSSGQGLRIKDITFETVEAFKNWLDTVDMYIEYALATPTEETIELPNIPTIKGTTILEVDTKIQPSNMKVVYKGK